MGEQGPRAITLARIDRHSGQLDELDVEGILAFAERVLPRAADLWVQASLEQRQRFQQLFCPDGIAFDGKDFVGTRVTAPAFSYLRPIEGGNEGLVDQTGIEPLRRAAGEAELSELEMGHRRPTAMREVVDQNNDGWNVIASWLRSVGAVRATSHS